MKTLTLTEDTIDQIVKRLTADISQESKFALDELCEELQRESAQSF